MTSITDKMHQAYGRIVGQLRREEPGSTVESETARKPADAKIALEEPTEPASEKPNPLDYVTAPFRRGPSIGGLGTIMRPQPVRKVSTCPPVEPAIPKLSIETLDPKSARSAKPMPAERLAANLSKSPEAALKALAKARLTATKELDRLGDKTRQLFPDREPER